MAPVRRRGPRAWFLIPLVLVVAAAGVGVGWLLQTDDGIVDPLEAERAVGAGVVTVLATTCSGTGRATGFLVGDNKVVTVASAIYGPVSVAIVTADGQVRGATVIGTSTNDDGLALLRISAPLDVSAPPRTKKAPAVGAEMALVGTGNRYIGTEDVGSGTVKVAITPGNRLASSVHTALHGAPLVTADDKVAGMATPGGNYLTAAELEPYLGASPPISPTATLCPEAWGPKDDPVTPTLEEAPSELSAQVMQTFQRYVRAVNAHQPEAIRATYTGRQLAVAPEDAIRQQHRTTYLFGPRVSDITQFGNGARARMIFTTIHSSDGPAASIDGGLTCARWNIVYTLMPDGGVLKLAGLSPKVEPCDGA
ncbi:hypothetical protein ACFFGN_30810 [Kribbella deserti]|uniref:Serine protease n=1 Tax=Kribbella deserti TaxID=1926257 RepID=A0ABV6QV46_9ACTN